MTTANPRFAAARAVAEQIHDTLKQRNIDCVVIGALALAVHRYPRATTDFDLAIAVPPTQLKDIEEALRPFGWKTDLQSPDGNDPLGGLINVRAPGAALVQLINFDNSPAGGAPRLVREAVAKSVELAPGSALRASDLMTLIAFKLYAGGYKSQLDILELLDRNPDLDLKALHEFCRSLRLSTALERLLAQRDGT